MIKRYCSPHHFPALKLAQIFRLSKQPALLLDVCFSIFSSMLYIAYAVSALLLPVSLRGVRGNGFITEIPAS